MKLYREKSQLSGSLYFELLPGPFCGKWWNTGSVFISEDMWLSFVAPMIVGRALNYDQYEEVEVPRAIWGHVLRNLEQLKRIVLDVESVGELQVEAHLTSCGYGSFQSDRDFPKQKAALLLFVEELHEWLTVTLTTHSSITILGL